MNDKRDFFDIGDPDDWMLPGDRENDPGYRGHFDYLGEWEKPKKHRFIETRYAIGAIAVLVGLLLLGLVLR